MTFNEAFKQLEKMARNEYCSMRYERTRYADGSHSNTISVYIAGYEHTFNYPTFKEAIKAMKILLNHTSVYDDNPRIKDKE